MQRTGDNGGKTSEESIKKKRISSPLLFSLLLLLLISFLPFFLPNKFAGVFFRWMFLQN
jgi:hypothetical protein